MNRRRRIPATLSATLLLLAASALRPVAAALTPYTDRPEVQAFIARLAGHDSLDPRWITQTLAAAQPNAQVLAAIAKPYEAKPWYEYRPLFVNPARVTAGVAFWKAHAAELEAAAARYDVPPALIVAILGVESFYGRQHGGYRVLDALTTLAFDYPPRAAFFQQELAQYLLLCHEQNLDPLVLTGSYAGAMGAPQFMPDSYRQYAVSADGRAPPDIWHNWADIIASVANYFHAHGWQSDGLVAIPAYVPAVVVLPADIAGSQASTAGALRRLGVFFSRGIGDEQEAVLVPLELRDGTRYWLGLHNFRVLTQYNKSALYAMAVSDLGRRIAEARAQGDHGSPP